MGLLSRLLPSRRGYGGDAFVAPLPTSSSTALSHTYQPPSKGAAPKALPRAGVASKLIGEALETLEHNPALTGNRWYGSPTRIGECQKMMKDSHVRAAVAYRCNPIRAGLWEIIPTGDRPIDIEAARFQQEYWIKRLNWDRILCDILLFHRDGLSLMEQTDVATQVDRGLFPLHQGNGIGVVPTGLHHIPAWTVDEFFPNANNPRELASFNQWVGHGIADGSTRAVDVRRDLILRFTQAQEGSNFTGVATLRSAYGPWKVKLTLTVVDAIKHERFGLGVVVGKLPENWSESDRDAFEQTLYEWRINEKGALILPFGYEVDITGASKSEGTDVNASLERCNRDIFINVGAQFASLGDAKFGSFALAQTIEGQFGLGIEGDAKFIEGVFNHGSDGWSPIRRINDLNYPSASPPALRVRNLPIHDYAESLKSLAELVKAGVIRPDEDLEISSREKLKATAPNQANRFSTEVENGE